MQQIEGYSDYYDPGDTVTITNSSGQGNVNI